MHAELGHEAAGQFAILLIGEKLSMPDWETSVCWSDRESGEVTYRSIGGRRRTSSRLRSFLSRASCTSMLHWAQGLLLSLGELRGISCVEGKMCLRRDRRHRHDRSRSCMDMIRTAHILLVENVELRKVVLTRKSGRTSRNPRFHRRVEPDWLGYAA